MKIILDITRLVEDGEVTPAEAERLKSLAARETGSLAINVLMAIGVTAIALSILAFKVTATTAIILGVALTAIGLAIQHYHRAKWGPLAFANILVGTLAVSGGTVYLANGHAMALLFVMVLLLALGAVARSGFLIGLAPFALASVLGSSLQYLHASYMLVVRGPTVTILVFAAAAWGVFRLSKRLPGVYERLALIFSRVSLIFVNFGFWIGSLWGDGPGQAWVSGPLLERQVIIPDYVFAVLWALALLAVGTWGVRQNRRFVVNVAAVFGAIHFYTQWFENFHATPWSIFIAGVITVGISVGLWKYNSVVLERPAAGAE